MRKRSPILLLSVLLVLLAALPAAALSPLDFAVSRTAAGLYHTLALDSDGGLWAWGDNWAGSLGTGDATRHATPVRIGTATDWKTVAAGSYRSVALKSDGSLWAWGYNYFGQLGTGDSADRSRPTRIGTDTDWRAVAAGSSHTVALKSDGTLWAWGRNGYGQLGTGDTLDRKTPTRIGTDTGWVAVSAADSHTVGLKSDGTLWAWGYNYFGQLGTGDTNNRFAPAKIVDTGVRWWMMDAGDQHIMALASDGSLWAWGNNSYGKLGTGGEGDRSIPTRVGTAKDWRAVSAGVDHSCALKSNGSLWIWGANRLGQLGTGEVIDPLWRTRVDASMDWQSVTAGSSRTIAVKTDGSLWTWGVNFSGVLGTGDTTNRTAPTRLRFPTVYRELTGIDRYETAIMVSKEAYPAGAPSVFLVKGDDFPDALAAAPLAASYGGPVVITPESGLTPTVAKELKRLNPSKVFFIGLPDSVIPGLSATLPAATITTIRGSDRYETAALLAEELRKKLGNVERIVLVSGDAFPDALSVAPLAAAKGWAILLTPQAGPLPQATAGEIETLGVTQGLVVGTRTLPPAKVKDVIIKVGADRYDTSAMVAAYGQSLGLSFEHVALATGEKFPDALVVAPLLVKDGGILLLTQPTTLPAPVRDALVANAVEIRTLDFVGLPAGIQAVVKGILP